MLKTKIIGNALLFTSLLISGAAATDFDKIKELEMTRVDNFLQNNAGTSFKEIKPYGKVTLNSITAYYFKISIANKSGEIVDYPQVAYSNGEFVFPVVIDVNEKKDAGERFLNNLELVGEVDEKHLIFGDKNAKNKLVIFSDPICPACIEYVPKVVDLFKDKPEEYGIYYYSYVVHKNDNIALGLERMIDYVQQNGIKWDFVLLDRKNKEINSFFDVKDRVEKKMGIVFPDSISKNYEIKENDVAKNNFILGTPTFFLNNKRISADVLLKNY